MYVPWIASASGFALFFFQSEDGIRDLVRSRGLGDVYKRQNLDFMLGTGDWDRLIDRPETDMALVDRERPVYGPVSYTHLTLPTSDLV